MSQQLIFSNNPGRELDGITERMKPKGVFLLVDENTASCVLPRLQAESTTAAKARVITIAPGDVNKNIDTLAHVWQQLGELGATRASMLVNAGGGVVTDLGAFAASTFKRGIRFVNIPTTLLAAVDASVGGKTGINYNGLKNEVGTFCEADSVIVSSIFFNTLPATELKSGYAEMIKHALLTSTAEFDTLTSIDVTQCDSDRLLELLKRNIEVKRRIVAVDPHEKGLRRALNLGHTAGHAFESLAMERSNALPHGYAVAYGLIVALILSHMKLGFPTDSLYRLSRYVKENYGVFGITCDDYPRLLALMGHDKKNEQPGQVNFTLLHAPGEPEPGVTVGSDDITAALDIYRDLLGL